MNIFYITVAILLIFVDMITSITPLKQRSIKKTLRQPEKGIHDVDFKEYPYVVRYEALQSASAYSDATRTFKSRHICSGAVISPSSTLTAAFCCTAAGVNTKTVIKFGETSREVLKCTQVASTRVPSHPLMMSDLAVLMNEPVTLPAYGRLSVIDFGSLAGQRVTILGYGLSDDSAKTQQNTLPLQRVDGMWSKCSDDVVYPVMCVTGTCGAQASCVKDSGGPVVHESGIVGVSTVAFPNYKCGQAGPISTIGFIYPVGSTVDMIASVVADIESKNKHKYFLF